MAKITDNSDDFLKAVEAKAQVTLWRASRMVERSAKRIVPVRTGNLQRSIHVEQEANRLVSHIGSYVHYAGYVEGGTAKMSARPYLRPALMENLLRIKKLFKAL